MAHLIPTGSAAGGGPGFSTVPVAPAARKQGTARGAGPARARTVCGRCVGEGDRRRSRRRHSGLGRLPTPCRPCIGGEVDVHAAGWQPGAYRSCAYRGGPGLRGGRLTRDPEVLGAGGSHRGKSRSWCPGRAAGGLVRSDAGAYPECTAVRSGAPGHGGQDAREKADAHVGCRSGWWTARAGRATRRARRF